MFSDVVQASLIQMINCDPHVFETAGDGFMWWSLAMMRPMRKHTQFCLDQFGLTTNISEPLTRPGFVS